MKKMTISLLLLILMSCKPKNSQIVIEALEKMYQNRQNIEEFCEENRYSLLISYFKNDKKYNKKISLSKIGNRIWEGEYQVNEKITKIKYKNGIFYDLENKKIKELENFKLFFQTDTIKKNEIKILSEVEKKDSMFPALFAEYKDKNSISNYVNQFGVKENFEKIKIYSQNRGETMGEIEFIDSKSKTKIVETCGYVY
ncbi:hypothetical protein [Leptotrichia hongkongensis]|uniref:hypothetical protein n=1 Tax=Leptotrichia hongkongensis TaxID=554406 RepID=UPI0035A97D29